MKHDTKTFLARCTGPLLLTVAVFTTTTTTMTDSMAPSPMTSETYEEYQPVETYATEGETYETYDELESYTSGGETMPLESAGGDSSCTTYDEDEKLASLLESTCEWNTYMCCWTGRDGSEDIESNSDICRVLDYPEEGDVLELPRDSEGPVYCHGFAWADGADVPSNILPLYNYVRNVGGGGFSGSVKGAPQCGCIEHMPVVDDAACSTFTRDGIVLCNKGLRQQYKNWVDAPNGPMESNLVQYCDNRDVPDYDFRTCELNTYMCCWTKNEGQGMKDNTDVCYVGDVGYAGNDEGDVHCHRFVWPEDATDAYIHLLAQFVQNFDHRDRRGYYGNIPNPDKEGRFTACTKNDLRTRFTEVYPDIELDNLVGQCDNAEE